MNNTSIILIISLICINLSVAQNYQSGLITTTKNISIKGKVLIDNDLKKVYLKNNGNQKDYNFKEIKSCLLYTSPSPRDRQKSRMPSSA